MVSARSKIKAKRKKLVEEYEERNREAYSGVSLPSFGSMMEEYFREKEHPRVVELKDKYFTLCNNNPNIFFELKKRYPSTRMTDIQYTNMWGEALNQPSIFDRFADKDGSFQGGTLPVPFNLGDKDNG